MKKERLIEKPRQLAREQCCNFGPVCGNTRINHKRFWRDPSYCRIMRRKKCPYFTDAVLPKQGYKYAKNLDLPVLHYNYSFYT